MVRGKKQTLLVNKGLKACKVDEYATPFRAQHVTLLDEIVVARGHERVGESAEQHTRHYHSAYMEAQNKPRHLGQSFQHNHDSSRFRGRWWIYGGVVEGWPQ